jgi:hypothetical protein
MTLLVVAPTACTINATLLPDNLVSTGTSFVVKGTMTLQAGQGPCLVWMGDNGIAYHLFQTPSVENATFDHINTPGVTSRLQIATRDDIPVACQVGTVVEVLNVLEVIN